MLESGYNNIFFEMELLEKSILATLSYYDIFDYPLTGFEVYRYLIRPGSPDAGAFRAGDVFEALDTSEELCKNIGRHCGFYFLAGRERTVEKRLWRKKLSDQKWKKLRPIFGLLTLVPFVRGIFVSGSLAMENSKDDSDVDIIVVARYGRIWTVRTLMTMLTSLLGVRRHGARTKDRICLNHYITDQSLRIPFESLYNAESYAHLLNVYQEDEAVFRQWQEENRWLDSYLVNHQGSELGSVRARKKRRSLVVVGRLFEYALRGRIGDELENFFSRIESARIRRDQLYGKAGGRITIDDRQLEFHPDSHEDYIIPEFNRRMQGAGLAEFAGQRDSGLNR